MSEGSSNEPTLHCAQCSYDLRLLDEKGVCPECGWPIGASITAANDPWRGRRRSVRTGAAFIIAGIMLRFISILAAAGFIYAHWSFNYARAFQEVFPPVSSLDATFAALSLRGSYKSSAIQLEPELYLVIAWLAECIGLALTTRMKPARTSWYWRVSRWGSVVLVLFFTLIQIVLYQRRTFGLFSLNVGYLYLTLGYVGLNALFMTYTAMWLSQAIRIVSPPNFYRTVDQFAAIVVVITVLLWICSKPFFKDSSPEYIALLLAGYAWLATRLFIVARPPRYNTPTLEKSANDL